MKNHTMFNYDYLFGDHFAKVSNQAKLYYIKLNFYANNGFVANPLEVLDSCGYDKGVLDELVKNGEILVIPDRCEVFITSYFIHNEGLKPFSWRATPYAIYWENRLYVKKNGVCDFKPEGFNKKEREFLSEIDVETNDKKSVNPNDETGDFLKEETNEGVDVVAYIKGENKKL